MTKTSRPWRALIAQAVAMLLLGACGGGGGGGDDVAGVGSGGTGTYSSGSITSFGSIVVNGIHFDQSSAEVIDGDGRARSAEDLALGMRVEVDAAATSAGRVKANRIRYASDLLGRVDSVGTSSLVVMGQTVRVNSRTQYSASLTLQSLNPNEVVEIYGYPDAGTDTYIATRIERKASYPVNEPFKLRGVIKDLDIEAGTCRIGNQVIRYDWAANTTDELGNGQVARAYLYRLPSAQQVWTATVMSAPPLLATDSQQAQVEGLVTDLSATKQFSVNGLRVNAEGIGCPACSGLALGTPVSVKGRLQGGTLLASEVTVAPE